MQKRTSELTEMIFCPIELPMDFPILCMRTDHWYTENQTVNMLHFHNCLQIGYCYDGSGHSLVEGHLQKFKSGNITVIPAKAKHHIISHSGTVSRWIWLYLDPFTLIPNLQHTHVKALMRIFFGEKVMALMVHKNDQNKMINIIQTIISELENKAEGYCDIVRLQVHTFLLLFLRAASVLQPITPVATQAQTQLIAPALQHISLNYMNKISVVELAALCHISTTHLRRMFHRVMNCAPLEYLQMIRLEAACILLFNSDLSILEISIQVGFPTLTSFTRQFKKLLQTTPDKWRRQRRTQRI